MGADAGRGNGGVPFLLLPTAVASTEFFGSLPPPARRFSLSAAGTRWSCCAAGGGRCVATTGPGGREGAPGGAASAGVGAGDELSRDAVTAGVDTRGVGVAAGGPSATRAKFTDAVGTQQTGQASEPPLQAASAQPSQA